MPTSLRNLSCETIKVIKRNTARQRNLLQHIHWQKTSAIVTRIHICIPTWRLETIFLRCQGIGDLFFKQSDSKCSPRRKIKMISQQLATDNCKRSNSELCRRLQNTFIEKTTSKFSATFYTNYSTRKNNCLERDRQNAGIENNSSNWT